MALAFKTLLSLAPLLAVIFSILKGLGVHNRIEPALVEALAPLGDKGQEITAYLIGFVDKMKACGSVSDRFGGLTRVARHRLVYDALQDLMQREIHALALTLVTADEVGGTGSETTSRFQG